MNAIIVLRNSNVWGVWSVGGELSTRVETEIKKMVREKVKELDSNSTDKYTVQFSENIPCDDLEELMGGIKESLENQVGYTNSFF